MAYTYRYPRPAVSTDIVVFTIRQDALRVLLVKRSLPPFRDAWALPGGFVRLEEGMEDGARRELEEETGLTDIYLEQLRTFGEPDRDPRERVITVAYVAVVPSDELEIEAAADADKVGWFGLKALPELAFDHQEIIKVAVKRLAARLDHETIAFRFLPKEFTLAELQQVYELIRREKIDKRNFRKRIRSLELVRDTGKERRNGAHRPARLFRVGHPQRIDHIK